MNSRHAAAVLARARSTLVMLEAADVQQRAARLFNRAGPRIVYKVNPNALVVRPPRLKYHRTEKRAAISEV